MKSKTLDSIYTSFNWGCLSNTLLLIQWTLKKQWLIKLDVETNHQVCTIQNCFEQKVKMVVHVDYKVFQSFWKATLQVI